MEYFKGNFPGCSVLNFLYVILICTISCPQSWAPYCRCDPNKEWQTIFKIGKLVLYLSLLRILWGSLGTSVFGNSILAPDNTQSRLPSRIYFRFLWLCLSFLGCFFRYCGEELVNWNNPQTEIFFDK